MNESGRSPGGAGPADHIRTLLQPEASLLWSLAQWDPETIPPDHDRVINWPLLLFMAEQERALWVVDRWVQRTDPGSIAAEARERLHELAQVEEFIPGILRPVRHELLRHRQCLRHRSVLELPIPEAAAVAGRLAIHNRSVIIVHADDQRRHGYAQPGDQPPVWPSEFRQSMDYSLSGPKRDDPCL